jgi:hypothetical protein
LVQHLNLTRATQHDKHPNIYRLINAYGTTLNLSTDVSNTVEGRERVVEGFIVELVLPLVKVCLPDVIIIISLFVMRDRGETKGMFEYSNNIIHDIYLGAKHPSFSVQISLKI